MTNMSTSPFEALLADLVAFIPRERLVDDLLRRFAYGTDASFYRLIPRLVVKVVDEGEVSRLILADGVVLDTGDPAHRQAFRVSHAELLAGVDALCADVAVNRQLAERIMHKIKI